MKTPSYPSFAWCSLYYGPHQRLVRDSGTTRSGSKSLLLRRFAVIHLKSVSPCLGFLIRRVSSYKIEIIMGCREGCQHNSCAQLCAWHRINSRAGDCLVVVRSSLLGLLSALTALPAPGRTCMENCALTQRAVPAPCSQHPGAQIIAHA